MPWRRMPEAPREEVEAYAKQFRKKARFLVDESMGIKVAEVLRDQGWNVKYVAELGLEGHSDEDVFARAWADNRIRAGRQHQEGRSTGHHRRRQDDRVWNLPWPGPERPRGRAAAGGSLTELYRAPAVRLPERRPRRAVNRR